ncbi:putative DRAP deaminase [Aspergillus ibericus CBS 121593]|uniref:Cytidine and deoxycytidylate deaminase zinc-binding domain protein n=1 Tax=Aspergillus ibericus CBS 121593 TaxID=1448316 RepID=A0A395GI16_9EURO|nr:cytidine and deoxycytidylate deaminase zinc-binding domain protein [Aspergillus ibericus CBS 121593]RAK95069.1 cytidine and deoxycytidylate deaminase zinc-binding domain protein [Aspergillus ibericus CBS 121593]
MTTPHLKYMRTCLDLASQAPALPTNFRVGAVLISRHTSDPTPTYTSDILLSTGHTIQHPGNTHAEQCCLANFASQHNVPPDHVADVLPSDDPDRKLVMYVTMEPCGKRLSGNMPCVERIIQTRGGGEGRGIEKVYFGVKEPGTFVGESVGVKRLEEAGIEWEVVAGLEREILEVAVAGHEGWEEEVERAMRGVRTDLDAVSEEERRRQEGVKRNPKKRMMEGEVIV